ncbi:hypothetical protein C8R46DRAFT_1119630 [Mycena filopes]|nr:hypothetical protein C8R46DRAFT_1119630 [Mycena filopes]
MSVSPESPCWQCGASASKGRAFLDSIPHPSPNIVHLLTSNDTPPDVDLPVIHARIDAGMARIDELSSQISMMQSAIARLTQERDEIEKFVRKHAKILSPIRRTPPELVFEILGQAWPSTRRIGNHTASRPPWQFGHICRSWRASALASPYLWNSVEIYHSSAFPAHDISPLPMLQTQYLRSASQPLEVVISEWAWGAGIDAVWMESFLSQSDRWKSLRLRISGYLFEALGPLRRRLPSLQMLELELGSGFSPIGIFEVVPKLSAIILTDPACRQPSPPFEAPWSQITHYRGTYGVHRQLEILSAAPRLVECGLGVLVHDPAVVGAHPVIKLYQLRKLHIKRSMFLDVLEAPMLTHLFMTGEVDALPSFLHRSSCHLTRLAVTYCTHIAAFTDVLRLLPGLTHLTLEPNFGLQQETKQLFAAMTLPSGSAPSDICPMLTAFAYGDRRLGDIEGTLMAMVESRVQRGTLSFFRLWLHSPPAAIGEQMNRLSEGGIDAAIISPADAAEFMMIGRP